MRRGIKKFPDGFTLVELMVVVIIMGVIAAVALSDLDIEIPNASNFTVPPTLYNDPARIATLARSDGSFTLCINSTGVVSCSGAAKICGGYAPGGTGVCP